MREADPSVTVFEAWDETELLQVRLVLEVFTPVAYGPTAVARTVRVPGSRFDEARQAIRDSLPGDK